ncbi:SNARE-binding exocyst subunit S6 [Malassezia vespertilionis]|uniref:Sec6p n=1 Tax=Malassezia vespertilionis TaxID=2020962 RepID=A0A2N1JD42_9BASI|nr:SNARE-binding exocyst subunit S6 [Malassezia vespertilionis]PKI84454.1 Sec6p [Malassezia vespertilionis]WFD06418.1 SNARE-binding exocyst subunit S6 [Malassezia vespertilionis]
MASWNAPSTPGLLAEYLKSPDDISKIAALRRKLSREHASLSAKLKSGAKDQLEATRDGLLQLQSTRREVAGIHEAFSQVESMFKEPTQADLSTGTKETRGAKSFRIISELSQLRRALGETSCMLAKFETMQYEIHALSQLVTQYQSDLLGSAPHLLLLHHNVAKWEQFRNETLHVAASSNAATQEQLVALLAPLDDLLGAFETYLMLLSAHVLDLVRHGQQSVVVCLLKIFERESREDEKTAAIKLAKRANIEGASRFPSIAAYAHTIKLYRLKFQETIYITTQRALQQCWDCAQEPSPLRMYEEVDWFYKDLDLVRDAVVPLFPSDYHVYKIYVETYHRALSDLLREKVSLSDSGANMLLELYHVAQEHQNRLMDTSKGIQESWIEPSLLGGREKTIMDDYLALLKRKVDEWSATLMHDEVTAFVSREKPPEEGQGGLYIMSGCVILFRMVNQQIDTAANAGDPTLLVRAIDHACTVMHNIQTRWIQIVQQEFKKQTEAKRPEEVNGGLVEYMIALANDQLSSADQTEALLHRVESIVAPQHMAHVREYLDNTLNGFLDISKHCIQLLVEIVLFDLRPAFRDLFTFPAWYVEGTTTSIAETIRDYTSDYAARLEPNLFDVLSDDLVTRLLTAYLIALRQSARLRMPNAAERFLQDANELHLLISSIRPADEAHNRVEVLHLIHAILSSSPSMVFLPYWSFAKVHGPNLAFFEALLRARDDMERPDVTSIMDSARRKVKQEGMTDVPESGPTIMSAVAQTQRHGLLGAGLLANWTSGAQGEGIAWGALAQSAQSYLGAAGWRGATS